MSRGKSLAQQIKELESDVPKDFDPEDAGQYASESDNDESNGEVPENTAREHYEKLGKSKLRKPQPVTLGPQYAGARVKRDALAEDEEDDPFAREYGDSESEEDNLNGSTSEGPEDEDMENGFDRSSEDDSGDEDGDTDLTDEEEDNVPAQEDGTIDRAELRKLLADDQKNVAKSLSQSAKADVEKGEAVKAQRKTFDALLNSRIKLQKGLVATNSLLATESTAEGRREVGDVVGAAEEAAVKLWNNLNALRSTLYSSKTGQKRTHKELTVDDSLATFWEDTQEYEKAQKKPRVAALDFWASKTRTTTSLPAARGRLAQPVKEQNLSDVLAGQMADMSRLVAKTQVPRSCAPVQAATVLKKPAAANGVTNGTHNDEQAMPIYDDADLYTTLLANLITQRSTDATINMSNLSIQPWQAAREAKTKKVVDTKASKGRKLRYTVHDKLVSFMAPEDRGSWGESQTDELFGSLFGRRVGLGEEPMEDEAEEDAEGQGLRLFGGGR